MFNAELIREEMEVSAVLDYHDMPYRKIGNHYDIYCPDPEHHDHHFGNCRMQEDGRYYCFACKNGGSIFDFFMQQFDCSFPQAAEMITEALGGPDIFLTTTHRWGSFDEDGFLAESISNKDKELLRLKKEKTRPRIPKDFTYEKPENGEFRTVYQKMDDEELKGYLIIKPSKEMFSLKALYNEDREAYDFLVVGKARERMIEFLEEMIQNPCNKKAKELFNRCRSIFLENGGILEREQEKVSSPFRNIPVVNHF